MVRFFTLLCVSAAIIVACTARGPSATTRLHDDIAANRPASVVKADRHLIIIDERLQARAALLHIAVAAIAVVSLCLAASVYFPLIAVFMRALAVAAGAFCVVVLALRSVLIVPDGVIIGVLLAAAVIAIARLVLHARALSNVTHEIVAKARPEAAVLSNKARDLVNRITARL